MADKQQPLSFEAARDFLLPMGADLMDAEPKPANASADKAQLDHFRQTARALGCDETGEAFERTFV